MAKPERMTCFVVSVVDQPGMLLKFMSSLKAKNISLAGLWGFAAGPGQAQIYSVAKNADKLRSALTASGYQPEEKTTFFVKGTDRAGALLKTLESLASSGLNIEALNAVAVGGRFGSCIWFNKADVEKAAKALA